MPRRRWLAGLLAAALALSACRFLHREGSRQPSRIDLNTAAASAVERLPGITPSMARQIVAGRPYGDPRELVDRNILTEHEFERIEDLITTSAGGR
ncbi:MAG TPA: helix-hairpin-helix domain-containing protein [Candidatus Binatus sp.]|jgi:DNA uptake protein ComE-like DNA-binding protein|nr:helix-hairpin-helix domain-containing protein [Candidatus Binatus sp.]